jgi:hypothetical protein
MILFLTLLFLKHFVADFLLQGPYQYLNKGTYGHLGGINHAMCHTFSSLFVLLLYCTVFSSLFTIPAIGALIVALTLWEGVIHYHIDWAKVKLNNYFKLKPDNSEKYWWLLGFDQLLHSLTYIGMAKIFFSVCT